MAQYSIEYTKATNDGSGNINWSLVVLDDDGLKIPGRDKIIPIPYAETQAATTGSGIIAKVRALLLEYAGEGWDNESLDGITAANLNSAAVNEVVDDLVISNGGYPFKISL